MSWLLQILLLIGVLFVLKMMGLPISIVGSVILTVVLSLVMMAFQRRSHHTRR